MPVKIKASGPLDAKIMVIGEAPGADEEISGLPFVGTAGTELTKMLNEAGILRSECYLTNVCKYRPPENKIEFFFLDKQRTKPNELIKEGVAELLQEIATVKPALIIALGNTPLWALKNTNGITKWRGSMLTYRSTMLMPTYHPSHILRQWEVRSIAVHDFRRAKKAFDANGWPEDNSHIIVRPSFPDVMDVLGTLTRRANESKDPLPLASDLETRLKYIACHGIAWSATEAISIPTLCVERPTGYWTLDEEVAIWERERTLLTHPNVEIVGQNYLYDAQYFARRRGYIPRLRHDTMFQQHVAFAGLPKGLDFLSSMYCRHHVYWKDEGKEWNTSIPEDQYWAYNGKDAIKTWEIKGVLDGVLKSMGMTEIYQFQMQLWHEVLEMMLQGVRIDQLSRGKIALQLMEASKSRQERLDAILGFELNVNSPKQVIDLFYNQLKMKVIRTRQTKKPTGDEDALELIAQREPLLRCLTEPITDLRSIGVMMSNVIKAELDADGRIRSSFSPTAETYRWKSSKNAFGGGANLQNWTKGDEDKEATAIIGYPIPNVRKLVIPDIGFEIASIDLSGADAQAVAWEADDEDLKTAFRAKVKVHAHNAKAMWPTICKTGFEQPYYDLIRTGVHLVNYCGKDKTLAAALGCPVHEATRFKDMWFRLHPGILAWHERIQDQLMRTRMVSNKFGYRRFYFERVADILPEAIAWIGQSNTACVCNKAFVAAKAERQLIKDLQIQFLIQVHDELVFQYPIRYREQVLKALKPIVHIPVPYDDPLTIPWGLKTSTVSWGDCVGRSWPE